jgi:RNA polymerase sigma-70 factor (ECF subfamily)
VRKSGLRTRHAAKVELAEEPAYDVRDPDERDPDERLQALQRAFARLAALDRALLMLYLDDHSQRDIAEILGISETNVATKINRLKQRLRREVAEAGLDGGERGAR